MGPDGDMVTVGVGTVCTVITLITVGVGAMRKVILSHMMTLSIVCAH